MNFEQKMSAYTCAKLLLFDPDSRTMYTTFFGGISGWTWDYGKSHFELAPRKGDKSEPSYFDGLAWIDHITTLIRSPQKTLEAVQPSNRLAAYLGTNAAFLPAGAAKNPQRCGRVRPAAASWKAGTGRISLRRDPRLPARVPVSRRFASV